MFRAKKRAFFLVARKRWSMAIFYLDACVSLTDDKKVNNIVYTVLMSALYLL